MIFSYDYVWDMEGDDYDGGINKMNETTSPRINREAISALRERGERFNFVPSLPHCLFAYDRPDLIGKSYKLTTGEQARIEEAAEFDHPHYIFDGIALKIKGYWRYGCPVQFIG